LTARPPVPAHPRLGTRLAYRMCGQCALPVTGYVCPMGCPKELRNGPCGGVGADGSCEVYPALRCVWVEAYERTAGQGRAADLCLLHRPVDHRRWGESSWLNYWQGRDEELWATAAGDTGVVGPSTNHHTAAGIVPPGAGSVAGCS
jgi:Methylene-tetrahydrofolate reductase C terminal